MTIHFQRQGIVALWDMQQAHAIHGVFDRWGLVSFTAGMGALVQFSYLQLLDLLTTLAFLANGVSEGNPIVALVIKRVNDPLVGLAVIKVFALGLGLYCWLSGRERLLKRTNACFAALITWNLIALIAGAGVSNGAQ